MSSGRRISSICGAAAILIGIALHLAAQDPGDVTTDPTKQSALRNIGWKLLADVIQEDGTLHVPKWRTWRQRDEVLLGKPRANLTGLALMTPPANLQPADPAETQREIYESVHFNPDADAHIRQVLLNERLSALRAQNRGEVSEFPPTAITVKAFWRKIQATGSQNIGIFDVSNSTGIINYSSKEETWPTQQCVSLQVLPDCVLVNEQSFYLVTVKDATAYSCIGCPANLQAGDKLALVGLHIAAKQRPDWIWATFWWKGGPHRNNSTDSSWTCDNAQRHDSIGDLAAPWDNYSMDVSGSFRLMKVKLPSTDSCGAPPAIPRNLELGAVFNPFVEARLTRGTTSNCIDCHARARTPHEDSSPSYITDPSSTADYPGLRNFEGRIRTDYVWSLALALDTQTTP